MNNPNEIDLQLESSKKHSESSKKKTPNRIQIYSKVAHDQSQTSSLDMIQRSQELYRAVDERYQVRRVHSMENDGPQHTNFLKLMQQQLEMYRRNYQDKFKEQLKENGHQMGKLHHVINLTNELLKQKDQQINELGKMLRNSITQNNQYLLKRILDCQIKLNSLAQNQSQLKVSITSLNNYLQGVEKGFLRLLACKQTNIQQKLRTYVDTVNHKLNELEECQKGNEKKLKSKEEDTLNYSMKTLSDSLNDIKDQVKSLKLKQFKYQNDNIKVIQEQLQSLSTVASMLEKKIRTPEPIKITKRKVEGKLLEPLIQSNVKSSTWSISQFSDYEKVYQELDSVDQDKFFHQSSKIQPFNGNDSFENFTSDEEDEETPNQKRLLELIKDRQLEIPLNVKVDSMGVLMLSREGIYLLDTDLQGFRLNELELTRLQFRGYIVF